MEKVNILLVDDQPGKLLSYQAILAELDENLLLASSGREALQCLLKQDIALILLDVIMPEMDGFETATLIRQHPRLARMPIIFVTAYSMSDLDRIKGYELGAVDYVFMPVVPEILRAKVSVFVELYRKRQELQRLNQTLTQTNAALVAEVAERKWAEAALQEERASLARRVEERTADLSVANAELARAARLKDEFLASMSHELRTPLNAVLGLCEALLEQVYGSINEKQLQALQSVQESGSHLLALINDILDLSKIEAGKLELEFGPVAVESICQDSLRIIDQSAQKKQLEISSTCDCATTTIQADARRLKQILVNLLSNAVKFTPEGGAIGLEVVGKIEHGLMDFTVWDTGIGISPEEMKRLFQPFIQLDSSLSRQYPGTGLGLALVRRLVELHGGGVAVKSEPAKGSRFTVSLPWQGPNDLPEKAKPDESVMPNVPAMHRALILLVEDNEGSIKTLFDYLLAKGYRVVVARNGGEAIERARETRPDLILMDIQMPGMDGVEATRRIQAAADLKNIPIIALTALAMPGDRERCLQAGAADYMTKPVRLKELVKRLEMRLNRNLPV